MCGSIKTGVHCCPRWVAPIKRHPELRANQGVEYVRCHDIIAAQFLVMRGPHGYHIFASVLWPCRTGYSSEPIDMTVARGIAGEAYSRSIVGRQILVQQPGDIVGYLAVCIEDDAHKGILEQKETFLRPAGGQGMDGREMRHTGP
jgi:hypothetical protein